MDIERSKAAIFEALHAPMTCRFEKGAAWDAILSAHAEASEHKCLELYIFQLGIIFAHCTGSLPGYSNGDNETKFERFVMSIPKPFGINLTRSKVKSQTRKLDAKRNPTFIAQLQVLRVKFAAE